MKKFWKALGIAALAAAVPVRFKKDEATGKKTYQSLLISVDVGPDESNGGTTVGINLGEGLLTSAIANLVGSKKEAVHFADNEPEAAVYADVPEANTVAAEKIETASEEAESGTHESAAEEEVTEEDFDPEL